LQPRRNTLPDSDGVPEDEKKTFGGSKKELETE
jgi:hypothetical protein